MANFERLKKINQIKNTGVLQVKPGYFLEIHETVGEGNNIRNWKFRGLVIKVQNPNLPTGTFTIRGKVAGSVIEKIYPLSFTKFAKVLLLDEFKIRRAKLYYIREKIGKDAKLDSILAPKDRGRDLFAELQGKKVKEKVEEVKVEEVINTEQEVDVETPTTTNEQEKPVETVETTEKDEATGNEEQKEGNEEEKKE